MNTIQEVFLHSELALAAYASLQSGVPNTAALEDNGRGMSSGQAERFASTYTVVAQYNDSSSLSATVFEDLDGNRYLAVRGTNDPADIWTDIVDIMILGTPERQAQYAALKAKIGEWMGDGTLPQSFTVTGHSLGGFLAGALLVDFPTAIEHAYFYNAPGVGGLSASLRLLLNLESDPSLDLSKASNVRADAGIAPISGLGLAWGAPISIAIENQLADVSGAPASFNHSQQVLTDALAVYELLERLVPELDSVVFKSLLHVSSPATPASLERILDVLERLLDINHIDMPAGNANRDVLYEALYSIGSNGGFSALSGKVEFILGVNAGQVASDFGQFLSLYYLLPFSIQVTDPTAQSTLESIHADLFARWQADMALPAQQRVEFSEAWFADRAKMLEMLVEVNLLDLQPGPGGLPPLVIQQPKTFFFQDVDNGFAARAHGGELIPPLDTAQIEQIRFGSMTTASEITGGDKNDRLYGGAGNDTLIGGGGNDYLEGGAGEDRLEGGEGNDTPVGGTGDDTLIGGSGTNLLQGGMGNDRYEFSGDFGTNVIEDADGLGSLWIGGVQVGALEAAEGEPGLYRDAAGRFEALRTVDGDGVSRLTITTLGADRGTIVINGWSEDENLGIALSDGAPAPALPAAPVQGGEGADFIIVSWPEETTVGHQLHGHGGRDMLFGSLGGDLIDGGDGDDWLVGRGGYHSWRLQSQHRIVFGDERKISVCNNDDDSFKRMGTTSLNDAQWQVAA